MSRKLTLADRDAWLAARREGIGSSDAAAIVGASPFVTPLMVYADKLGIDLDITETPEMRFGRLLEPIIADEYARETGRERAPAAPFTISISDDVPYLRATLDREIISAHRAHRPPEGCDVPAVLEIKTTSAFRADDWSDEPPAHVQVQGQHQLLVTGAQWVSFAVLIGGATLRWCDMKRNERFLDILRARLAAFWRRVEQHDPPHAGPADREALAALYPRPIGGVVALSERAELWDLGRTEAIAQLKHWQSVKDEAENNIRAEIGDALEGLLPNGGGRYTWRTIERAATVLAASSYRQLRRHER